MPAEHGCVKAAPALLLGAVDPSGSGRYSNSETISPIIHHNPSDNARMDNSASPRLSGGLLPGGGRRWFCNTVDRFNAEVLLEGWCAAVKRALVLPITRFSKSPHRAGADYDQWLDSLLPKARGFARLIVLLTIQGRLLSATQLPGAEFLRP